MAPSDKFDRELDHAESIAFPKAVSASTPYRLLLFGL
jgi:hypothetical protein